MRIVQRIALYLYLDSALKLDLIVVSFVFSVTTFPPSLPILPPVRSVCLSGGNSVWGKDLNTGHAAGDPEAY